MTYNKEWYRRYAEKNREKLNLYQKEWAKENRDKRNKYQNNWKKRNTEKVRKLKHESYLRNREKTIERVRKYYLKNKERLDQLHKVSSKIYRKNNKERVNAVIREWGLKNKDRVLKNRRAYVAKNRARMNAYANTWGKNKRASDISHRISYNIGIDIWHALKENKNGRKWQSLVGYTVGELKEHLEKQFDSNMCWENYGSYWTIDHIKPRSLFHFTEHTDQEFKECWALKNLQPLEKIANIRKGNKYA